MIANENTNSYRKNGATQKFIRWLLETQRNKSCGITSSSVNPSTDQGLQTGNAKVEGYLRGPTHSLFQTECQNHVHRSPFAQCHPSFQPRSDHPPQATFWLASWRGMPKREQKLAITVTANFDNCWLRAKKQFNFHDNPVRWDFFLSLFSSENWRTERSGGFSDKITRVVWGRTGIKSRSLPSEPVLAVILCKCL